MPSDDQVQHSPTEKKGQTDAKSDVGRWLSKCKYYGIEVQRNRMEDTYYDLLRSKALEVVKERNFAGEQPMGKMNENDSSEEIYELLKTSHHAKVCLGIGNIEVSTMGAKDCYALLRDVTVPRSVGKAFRHPKSPQRSRKLVDHTGLKVTSISLNHGTC